MIAKPPSETASTDEAKEPVTRKYYIENMDYTEVQKVPVKIGEAPPEETPKTESE